MRRAYLVALVALLIALKLFFIGVIAAGYYEPTTPVYTALQPIVLLLAVGAAVSYFRSSSEYAQWVVFAAVTLDLISYLVEFGLRF